MITIMYADDNLLALEHFSRFVNWKENGFELVAMAEDGIEAWKKFRKFQPDVVITDIKMPGMSGIELAAKIKEQKPSSIVIFLSSYNEFDYARTAMKLSVHEYILRDELTQEKMLQKLSEIRTLLKEQGQRRRGLQASYLSACLKAPDGEMQAPLCDEPFGLLVIEQDHVPEPLHSCTGLQIAPAGSKELKELVASYCQEILCISHLDTWRWICICDPECDLQRTVQQTGRLLNVMLHTSFSVFPMGKFTSAVECGRELEHKLMAYSAQRFWQSQNAAVEKSRDSQRAESRNNELQHYCRYLEEGKAEDCQRELERLFLSVFMEENAERFFDLFGRVYGIIQHNEQRNGISGNAEPENPAVLLTATGALKWLKQRNLRLLQWLERQPRIRSKELELVRRYIYQEYSNPLLSMEEIAEYAGLTAGSLNYMFKKECAETAGHFLTRVRMERAAELLLESNTRISDIPRAIGYSTPSYFTRAFQKYYGMTPTEYRLRQRRPADKA